MESIVVDLKPKNHEYLCNCVTRAYAVLAKEMGLKIELEKFLSDLVIDKKESAPVSARDALVYHCWHMFENALFCEYFYRLFGTSKNGMEDVIKSHEKRIANHTSFYYRLYTRRLAALKKPMPRSELTGRQIRYTPAELAEKIFYIMDIYTSVQKEDLVSKSKKNNLGLYRSLFVNIFYTFLPNASLTAVGRFLKVTHANVVYHKNIHDTYLTSFKNDGDDEKAKKYCESYHYLVTQLKMAAEQKTLSA